MNTLNSRLKMLSISALILPATDIIRFIKTVPRMLCGVIYDLTTLAENEAVMDMAKRGPGYS